MFLIYWTSRDGGAFYEVGSFKTFAAAARAMEPTKRDMLARCDDETRATVEAGRFTIERASYA